MAGKMYKNKIKYSWHLSGIPKWLVKLVIKQKIFMKICIKQKNLNVIEVVRESWNKMGWHFVEFKVKVIKKMKIIDFFRAYL